MIDLCGELDWYPGCDVKDTAEPWMLSIGRGYGRYHPTLQEIRLPRACVESEAKLSKECNHLIHNDELTADSSNSSLSRKPLIPVTRTVYYQVGRGRARILREGAVAKPGRSTPSERSSDVSSVDQRSKSDSTAPAESSSEGSQRSCSTAPIESSSYDSPSSTPIERYSSINSGLTDDTVKRSKVKVKVNSPPSQTHAMIETDFDKIKQQKNVLVFENLPTDLDEASFTDFLSNYGAVKAVHVKLTDHSSIAYVRYDGEEACEWAMSCLEESDSIFPGRRMTVHPYLESGVSNST